MIYTLIIWIRVCVVGIVIWREGWFMLDMVWRVGIRVGLRMAFMIFFFSCLVRTGHRVSNSPLKFNYISNNTKNEDESRQKIIQWFRRSYSLTIDRSHGRVVWMWLNVFFKLGTVRAKPAALNKKYTCPLFDPFINSFHAYKYAGMIADSW